MLPRIFIKLYSIKDTDVNQNKRASNKSLLLNAYTWSRTLYNITRFTMPFQDKCVYP